MEASCNMMTCIRINQLDGLALFDRLRVVIEFEFDLEFSPSSFCSLPPLLIPLVPRVHSRIPAELSGAPFCE